MGYRLLPVLIFCLTSPAHGDPLEHFSECSVCPEMVELPLGSFMMGAQPNEIRRAWIFDSNYAEKVYRLDSNGLTKRDELPRHRVNVDVPIAIGRTEITYEQWMACVTDGGCDGYVPPEHLLDNWIGGSHPVTRVSFGDVQTYLDWLNDKLATSSYRLPTEAEWEYAARAGTQSRFAQGDTLTSGQANFARDMTEFVEQVEYPELLDRGKPVPVENLDAANAWGLRHMSGNVIEYTMSCYSGEYQGWTTTSKWLEERPTDCDHVAERGGDYQSSMDLLRVAWRSGISKTRRSPIVGFRVVKQLNQD